MNTTQLSVQLYSLGANFTENPTNSLEKLHAMGLRNVEGVNITHEPAAIKETLDRLGLAMPTAHANFLSEEIRLGEYVMQVPPFEQVLDATAELGVKILIDPMVSPERWSTKEGVTELAERLNRVAAEAKERGLRVGYHNHSFEFHHKFDGIFAFEYFAGLLDPEVVLELDVFWAATGGADVVSLLNSLGEKVRALHVKDGIIGADPMAPEHGGDMSLLKQLPAGQGEMPFTEILHAAPHAEYAVIEFDTYDGDIFEGAQTSVHYFNKAGIR